MCQVVFGTLKPTYSALPYSPLFPLPFRRCPTLSPQSPVFPSFHPAVVLTLFDVLLILLPLLFLLLFLLAPLHCLFFVLSPFWPSSCFVVTFSSTFRVPLSSCSYYSYSEYSPLFVFFRVCFIFSFIHPLSFPPPPPSSLGVK